VPDSPTAGVPIVDGHCHPPILPPRPRDAADFLGLFTESREPLAIAQVANTLYVQRALRDLAMLHDCAAEPEALLAARQRWLPPELLAHCMESGGIFSLLLDGGYRTAECYSVPELAVALPSGRRALPVLRLEPLLEELLARSASFTALEEAFDAVLAGARDAGYVALKSIIAYRSGLAVALPAWAEATAAYAAVRRRALGVGGAAPPPRLTEKPLLDYFLLRACQAAARQALPVQLHTGFGDADLDLLQANPLLLRPALEGRLFGGALIVLLHAYPYLREAAYLANLYAGVYVDVSLTVPLVGVGCQRAVEEVLELAPTTRVLYGSDAAGLVESVWLGALAIRRALDGALAAWVASGALLASQAARAAEQVLHDNATALYGLGSQPSHL
jgi:predicted TIM-barrel fold metal-dependent hydrolase